MKFEWRKQVICIPSPAYLNEYSVMKHNRTQSNLKERLSSITDTIEKNRTHNKNNLAERNRVPSARKAGKRKRPSRRENLWTTCNREGLVSKVLFFSFRTI